MKSRDGNNLSIALSERILRYHHEMICSMRENTIDLKTSSSYLKENIKHSLPDIPHRAIRNFDKNDQSVQQDAMNDT